VDGPYRCTTHPSHGAHLGHQPHGRAMHLFSKHAVDFYYCVQRLAASSHQQSCEAMEDGFPSGRLDHSKKALGYLQLDSRSFDHCIFSTTDTKLQILCLMRLDEKCRERLAALVDMKGDLRCERRSSSAFIDTRARAKAPKLRHAAAQGPRRTGIRSFAPGRGRRLTVADGKAAGACVATVPLAWSRARTGFQEAANSRFAGSRCSSWPARMPPGPSALRSSDKPSSESSGE
jgi:hypothetical protein